MSNIKFQKFKKYASIIGNSQSKFESGYTLIELLVVMAIAGILLGFISINLVHTQQSTSLNTAEEMLIADIKSQQVKAMQGTDGGGSFGIHFSSNNTYTLFAGTTYVPAAATNADVHVDGPLSFSGSDIVFDSVSGEVHGYASPVSVTVTNASGGGSKTIQLNKYGVVIQE